MRLDAQNLFSDQQSLAVAAGTVVSTNVLDTVGTPGFTTDTLGNTPLSDIGRSPDTGLLVQVTEQFAGGTSVQVQLAESANANMSSPNVLQMSAVIPDAALKPGYQFRVALPAGFALRYVAVQYVLVGTHTTGKITAGIVDAETGKQTAPGTSY